ncbi:GDSL-type esterase/lipase family protein [Rhizobium rhizogenes]|uniref:GDSL-type esterase/lipase family protein n=1 Tax=Rhizobium rhizogenes TaxID=359 RepID=UPI001571B18A|nr:GDSL-type esterase/lipase family protein [Rhizobium rhizogenes]NTH22824.1 hypothetical protein [Rhizobium rhizogenes]NTH35854.1 hypothetical protein [Rhizobium rhizogenes]
MIQNVLCFGDSNTFGLKPNPFPWTRERWAETERWPTVLATLVAANFISEGLPGRTAATVNHGSPHLDAIPIIPALMESHTPIDTVIVMRGTNDLQSAFNLSPEAITIAMAGIVKSLRKAERIVGALEPRILVLSPPVISEVGFRSDTFAGAAQKSLRLARLYEGMASALGADFLDASIHVKSSDIDGLHLDTDQHIVLAHAIAEKIKQA